MIRQSVSAENRRKTLERAVGFCEYCFSNSRFSSSPFDVEHIIPVAEGGKSESTNLALACHGCNLFKSNKTQCFDTATDKMVRLFNPRLDIWNEHFTWTSSFTEIVGLTAIGRVTVEALDLNREGSINQRRMLHKYGRHPPE